jgi:hypothetical protein
VTDIAAAEEVFEQTRLGVNRKSPNRAGRMQTCWELSPAFERAKVARDPKPVQPTAKPIVVAVQQPSNAVLCADASNAEIRTYDDLIGYFKKRADELNISRLTLDHIAGLPDGLSSKVLGLKQTRRIGMATLEYFLQALALRLVVIPDPDALERNRSRYVARDAPHAISAKKRWSKRWKIRGTITATFCASPWPATAEVPYIGSALGE